MVAQDLYNGPLVSVLRLFLSVDLIGSTAFKQANQTAFTNDGKATGNGVEPWFVPMAQFYKEIERIFAHEWKAYVSGLAVDLDWPPGSAPQLWKSAGDELLYLKEITDHRQALACIVTWKNAIEEYRPRLKERHPSLDLKCTAWIAGFPVTNTEVVFSKDLSSDAIKDDDDPVWVNLYLLHKYHETPNDKNLTKDFIGPSVDAGFRLCALSSARRFVMSVDLALMVVHALSSKPPKARELTLTLRYEGRRPLKGVLGDKDYPVFWVDMAKDSSLDMLEDKLLKPTSVSLTEIKEFCEEFFASNPTSAIIPYIKNNSDKYFGSVPEGHVGKIQALRQYWEGESQRRVVEGEARKAQGEGSNLTAAENRKILGAIKHRLHTNKDS